MATPDSVSLEGKVNLDAIKQDEATNSIAEPTADAVSDRATNGFSTDDDHITVPENHLMDAQLDDSGDCPLLDTGLPPPPERSPPPLLPNDDDDEESVDSLLTKKHGDFVLEPPFLSALAPSTSAKPDETAPPALGVDSVEDAGPISAMGFADLLVQGETSSQLLTSSSSVLIHDDFSCSSIGGQVFSAVAEVIPDLGTCESEEKDEGAVEEKEKIDSITVSASAQERKDGSKVVETKCLDGTDSSYRMRDLVWTQASVVRPLEMRSVYTGTPISSYASPAYFSSSTAPAAACQSPTGASNLFARVRNASANSGCTGLPLLRHVGGGYHQQEETKQPSGGSERDLPLTQLSSAIAYDNALGKDKTHRWSFAGTAPEVALLRLKLENVERELKELRGKHETTMNDYQAVLHQLELCRAAKCRQDVDLANVTSELARMKAEYDAACQQRLALERQITEWQFKLQSKQVEVDDLRQQARDLSRQPGELASKLMEEYEELRIERDKLREQCRYLDNANADLRMALLTSQNEACQMRRDVTDLRISNGNLESKLKAAWQDIQKVMKERDFLHNETEMVKQQYEEACADRTRLISWRQTMEGDYQQLRQTHDGFVTEYRRVMSERDTILKENERHSEEKAELRKKLKAVENDYHSALDQLKNLEMQLHHLQHHQHQKFENSREDLMSFNSDSPLCMQHTPAPGIRRVLPAIPASSNTGNDSHMHHPFVEQRSIASSESEVALITGRAQEEELDEMRRQMESAKEQMELARQQLDDAKTRRDWALSERQRIVAERDSMRAMCDTLRRERDDAITRLATAIRDTDELQRQKEIAEREWRKLREKIETEAKQKASHGGAHQLNACSPSNSRDSAIDTDMAEWEIETLELSVDSAHRNTELGIDLGGGRDDPAFGGSIPIYVKALSKNNKFESVLRPYDCIVQVNNIDVTNMERRSVLDILRNSTAVKMVIRRRRLVGMKLISVPISSSSDGDLGVIFENGVYVSRIKTSSPAAKAGNLAVGDRLVYVNDLPVHGKAASDVHDLLESYKGCSVVLAVMKSPPVMSPTTSWPGGLTSNATSYGVGGTRSGKTSGAGIDSATISSSNSRTVGAHRDESVQTLASSSEQLLADPNLSSSGSCLALPKKQESLLDKVHDKIFRKAEKKPTVKALANIPVEPVINCGPKTSVRFDRNRYIRANSACSGSSSGSNRSGNGASPEQQVLQQLDRILEDSEREPPVNKGLAIVANADKSSGGTWPKSRGMPPVTTVGSGVSTVSQSKTGPPRKPVFEVFQPPISSSSPPPPAESSKENNWNGYASPLVSSPPHYIAAVRPRQSNSNNSRRRQHEITRPLSYHPAVPVYPTSSNPSAGIGFGSPLSSSGTVMPYHGRQIVDPLAGSSAYSHKPNFPSPLAVGQHHRPPSSQSNRRNKAISQYEPIYDDAGMIFPKATPATVVKQHHQTHLAFVTPVRQVPTSPRHQLDYGAASSSPWAPRSPTALYPPSQQFDQADDVSSMNSLNSPTPMYSNSRGHYHRKDYDSLSLQSPNPGEARTVHIEKQFTGEGLGIRILSHGNGVFISAVEKDSLAARNGLRVGDQLLDVCGINMRSANMQVATNVLSQLNRTDQITLVVQYNQNRYLRAASDYHHQQSAASTPRATPNSMSGSYIKSTAPSRDCTQMQQSRETLGGDDVYNSAWSEPPPQPHFVFIKRESSGWPFTLIGGNLTGIFIDTVNESEGDGSLSGLRCGDQILEFDGVNFRKVTMEQALFELQQRPVGADFSMLVQHNETMFQRSKRGAGDLFYVRVTVDRQGNKDELTFKAGDILRVDNTVFNGVPGLWRAWAVDQEGRELTCGIIPSKQRLEDEFIFRRSGSEISGGDGSSEGGSRRGTIRRSLKFMRRSSRSTHQRAPSKDSRELIDAADTVIADELYQRVERLDYKQKRPVLIVGALVDILVAKLMEDYPKVFAHCAPECVQPASISILNQGLQQNIYIDYQKRDKLFEITRVAALKELMDQGFHCILRVSLSAIERLYRLQIYPVVVYVKFKDYKQIKELSEGQVNSREAKEMFQQSAALEAEFHHAFTAVIHGQHCNVKYICQRIADAVEHEQKKTLWILSSENL